MPISRRPTINEKPLKLTGADTAYLAAIKKSGKSYDANNDGNLSQAEFLKACKDGVFAAIK
jgi:hypothetical protein